MSPNDVKAIKLCAQFMGVPERNYNPIESHVQAEELRQKAGLEIRHPLVSKRPDLNTWIVLKDEEEVGTYTYFSRNHAIVYGACDALHPGWNEKPLFGIDFRFDAKRWIDAAGPIENLRADRIEERRAEREEWWRQQEAGS